MRNRIVAGNWKMNMNAGEARSLFEELSKFEGKDNTTVIVAPPSIYISEFSKVETSIELSAQNCSENENGAYTGEVSSSMLSSLGIGYCIVGHSERRQYQKESNELLKQKVDQLLDKGVTPIYCCGETLSEREAGDAFNIVESQIKSALFHLNNEQMEKVVIAYEPVWAIGTGVTASKEQAQEIHAFIRALIGQHYSNELAEEIHILYGGSVKPGNAQELFSQKDIDGGLIGGASLKASDFIGIIQA